MNDDRKLGRREFLKSGTVTAAVSVGLLLSGQGGLQPRKVHSDDTVFYNGRCGQADGPGPKILVTYASYLGTTGGIAQAIGESLCERGADVDIRQISQVGVLSPYQAVVIGSLGGLMAWAFLQGN